MSNHTDNLNLAVEAAKGTPPTAVIAATLAGLPMNDIVLYGSALLILLQLVLVIKKMWDTFVKKKGTNV